MRCAACERPVDDAPNAACWACGRPLHLDCAAHGRCPSLACGPELPPGRRLVGTLAGAACLAIVGLTMLRAKASIELMFVVVAIPVGIALVLGAVRLLDLARSPGTAHRSGRAIGLAWLVFVAGAPLWIAAVLHRAGFVDRDPALLGGVLASAGLAALLLAGRRRRG